MLVPLEALCHYGCQPDRCEAVGKCLTKRRNDSEASLMQGEYSALRRRNNLAQVSDRKVVKRSCYRFRQQHQSEHGLQEISKCEIVRGAARRQLGNEVAAQATI